MACFRSCGAYQGSQYHGVGFWVDDHHYHDDADDDEDDDDDGNMA